VLNIQFGSRMSIPQKYISKKIRLGHKHLALGNAVVRKEGSYMTIFGGVEKKILCSMLNLEASCQSYLENNISLWGINLSLRVIQLREKKGSYSDIFEGNEGKLLCLIFNLEAGSQSYREIALQKIILSGA
jgi:hypothetical protein